MENFKEKQMLGVKKAETGGKTKFFTRKNKS